MFTESDLRGIVTIIMPAIFILAIFVPVFTKVLAKVDIIISEIYIQAVI